MKHTPPLHQGSPTVHVDAQTLANDLRYVHTYLAKLLNRSARKQRSKTALHTLDNSEHSLEGAIGEEVSILDRAALDVVHFHEKPRGPTLGQL